MGIMDTAGRWPVDRITDGARTEEVAAVHPARVMEEVAEAAERCARDFEIVRESIEDAGSLRHKMGSMLHLDAGKISEEIREAGSRAHLQDLLAEAGSIVRTWLDERGVIAWTGCPRDATVHGIAKTAGVDLKDPAVTDDDILDGLVECARFVMVEMRKLMDGGGEVWGNVAWYEPVIRFHEGEPIYDFALNVWYRTTGRACSSV